MNEYDSLRAQRILTSAGYLPIDDMDLADIIFLNTCSVREKPEQKVYSFLGRLRRLKARNPDLKIVVAGCLAQQLGNQLLARFPHLDLVLGTRGLPAISRLIDEIKETGRRLSYAPEQEESYHPEFTTELTSSVGEVTAPVTIMQGCDNFCTYCIVPYVRGQERSRPSDDILAEIRTLAAAGTREILLLGQNVNSYGRGLQEKTSFVDLLHMISAEAGITRIRFTTSHPKDLTDRLIQCFAELSCLCKYLHLPFQSGSDKILKLMNRGYSSAQYLEKIAHLRSVCPDVGLSSDVMVGFPGETDQDFQDTMDLIREVQFDNLFSFRYSDRPYAKAKRFPNKISEEVKARRLIELQALQAGITLERNEREVGTIREILVEGPSKASRGQLTGRTHQNRIVNFEGPQELKGHLVRVKITSASSHSLRGDLLDC